jgi:hypothetical protein
MMPTPKELREEAVASARLARLVASASDKRWLNTKAEALRRQADRQEQERRRQGPPD